MLCAILYSFYWRSYKRTCSMLNKDYMAILRVVFFICFLLSISVRLHAADEIGQDRSSQLFAQTLSYRITSRNAFRTTYVCKKG